MEANSVTGPAKNLLGFGTWLQTPAGRGIGLRVALTTFVRGRARKSNGLIEAARAAGIDTYVIRERFRYDPAVIPQLRDLVTELRPVIVQTHNNKSHLLARSIPADEGRHLWFAFHHGDTHTNLKQRIYNQVDRMTLRSADRVITVCEAFVPGLVSRGVNPHRIRVLHNAVAPVVPVSESARRKLREELAIGTEERVILTIGRLSREKGQQSLIEALAQLTAPPLEPRLILLGAGPDMGPLKRQAQALGLAERVSFVGFHADVAPYYAIADVFVLPSLSEGSSNVLLEAMSAGVPIVATDVGGNPEIALHQETALLVPPADPKRLAGSIARLLSDRDFAGRLAQAGQARATAEFSLQRYRQRLTSAYAQVLGSTA